MIKYKKKGIALLALVVILMQPIGTTPRAQAAVCQSIDPFLVISDYLEQWRELKAWWDSLKDMAFMYEININISIPCPGEEGFNETMSEIGSIGNRIPSSWATVESTQPDMGNPIFAHLEEGSVLFDNAINQDYAQHGTSFGILSIPRQEPGETAKWLEITYGSTSEGAIKMGANPLWLSSDPARQVNEVVFLLPEGLYKEKDFGWVIKDQFVIDTSMSQVDYHSRQIQINESMQELYLLEQIKQRAEAGAMQHHYFLSGKPESYVLDLIRKAKAGDEDSQNRIREIYRSIPYAEEQLDRGNKFIALNDSIDSYLIRMTRQHLRGLDNINAVTAQQDSAYRQMMQQQRNASEYDQLRWDADKNDLDEFFANTSNEQDIDILRHGFPVTTIMRHDLLFLRDNPELRTGEFLLNGYASPEKAVRVANILIGRALDVDYRTTTLNPDAPDEFQINGWNYVLMNNILRDGLTRLTMAREYLESLENKKKFYTPEIINETDIGELHLLAVRSELELHSIKAHTLESQLRRERLLAIYMTLEMGENIPDLDYITRH